MLELGDIVIVKGTRYVVAEFLGHPSGGRLVRLVDRDFKQMTRDEAGLTLHERPVFELGESVRVDEQRGTVGTTTSDIVSVDLPARSKELESGYSLAIDVGSTDCPKWKLVVENRL
jgi:hypothetical protein